MVTLCSTPTDVLLANDKSRRPVKIAQLAVFSRRLTPPPTSGGCPTCHTFARGWSQWAESTERRRRNTLWRGRRTLSWKIREAPFTLNQRRAARVSLKRLSDQTMSSCLNSTFFLPTTGKKTKKEARTSHCSRSGNVG